MTAKLNYSADEIRFDRPNEQRLSVEDSRQLIVIDIDRMGAGYRAIINGCEIEMPSGLATIEEARNAAIQIAIAEIAAAAKQLIDTYFE